MKIKFAVAMATLSLVAAAAPALAQAPAAAPATAPAEAAGPLSVDKTPISAIIANPAAKAALEKQLPQIADYYDQIKDMTLSQVAPMSQGAIDDAKLKAIQADFDKIK